MLCDHSNQKPFSSSFSVLFLALLWSCLFSSPGLAQGQTDWAIEPRFEKAGSAFEGVVPVMQGGKWGLISFSGNWVIQPQFEEIGALSFAKNDKTSGRLAVMRNGKWGTIDAKGNQHIPLKYDEIARYSGSVAPAKLNGRWYFLDDNGNKFGGKHIAFTTIVGAEDGCITGYVKKVPHFEMIAEKGSGKKNRLLKASSASKIFAPAEGMALFIQNDKRGWIGCAKGDLAIKARWQAAKRFSEGLAAVKSGGKWGFINQNGNYAITPRYSAARNFSKGLAPVRFKNGLWGYIDTKGNQVIGAKFDRAYGFADQMAGVRMGDKRGFIDFDGNYLLPPQFEDFWRPSDGLAPVKKNGLWGLARASGSARQDKAKELQIPLAQMIKKAESKKAEVKVIPTQTQYYHAQDIVSQTSVTFSPDKRFMVTTLNEEYSGSVLIWNFESKTQIRKFENKAATKAILLNDSKIVAVGERGGALTFWSVETGQKLASLQAFKTAIHDLILSPSGTLMAATDGAKTYIWSLETGEMLQSMRGGYEKLRFSKDETELAGGSAKNGLIVWDVTSGKTVSQARFKSGNQSSSMNSYPSFLSSLAISSDFSFATVSTKSVKKKDGFYKTVFQVDAITRNGQESHFPVALTEVLTIAFSDTTGYLAVGGMARESEKLTTPSVALWDIQQKKRIRTIAKYSKEEIDKLKREQKNDLNSAILASTYDRITNIPGTDKLIIVGSQGMDVEAWDMATASKDATFGVLPMVGYASAGAFDGMTYSMINPSGSIATFDLSSAKVESIFRTGIINGGEVSFDASPDGDSVYMFAFFEEAFRAYDPITGQRKKQAEKTHYRDKIENFQRIEANRINAKMRAQLKQMGFDHGGATVFARGRLVGFNGGGGTEQFWDLQTGTKIATAVISDKGEWVIVTKDGFFNASDNGAELLSVSRGLDSFAIGQVYDKLYRPDLVAAAFAGDPEGKVASAASVLNLGKLIDGGMPPKVTIAKPYDAFEVEKDEVKLTLQIEEQDGGYGRIEYRVNGHIQGGTRGLGAAFQEESNKLHEVVKSLQLLPGKNEIEVVVYNKDNTIASNPASITIISAGKASRPAELFVVSVGINDYFDSDLRLNHAVSDANAIAEAASRSGKRAYSKVHSRIMVDDQVTSKGLESLFSELAGSVKPHDTFLFFIAGHGKTQDGRYYFLPQNFRFRNSDSIAKEGIGQETWQDWFSRIPAQRSLLLYDTCESGTLTADGAVQRGGLERKGAIDRFAHATGRAILTASTGTAPALEGYKGHGLFTYALLEAFAKADENADKALLSTELATYVDLRLPELSKEAFGYNQIPQMKLAGNAFPIGTPVAFKPSDKNSSHAQISLKPTHMVIAPVKILGSDNKETGKALQPGLQVTLVTKGETHSLIAIKGNPVGSVKNEALLAILNE